MRSHEYRLLAKIVIADVYCKECHNLLVEVRDGWFESALFCPKCKNVYALKLTKIPNKKISKEFLEQAEKEAQVEKEIGELRRACQESRKKPDFWVSERG